MMLNKISGACSILLLLLLVSSISRAQKVLNLYSENTASSEKAVIPNSKPSNKEETYTKNAAGLGIVTNVTKPTLTVFIPKKPNSSGASVIICPGGGYSILAIDHEGYDVAKSLNDMGITAFVLKYRLPDSSTMQDPAIGPLQDAQEAIRMVKANAATFKIDSSKVGILGFSAGGHLASTAGTHFNKPVISNAGNISLRPAFMVLVYPVISFADSITHKGSKERLVGKLPSPENVQLFSNENQITPNTPPAFLVHAADDNGVVVANSINFFQALLKNKVAAEMHIYQNGGHGFGLNNKTTKDEWIKRLQNWFYANTLLQ